ncbi:MAG: DM13 domain-containing protein [Phormidesmis sp.]
MNSQLMNRMKLTGLLVAIAATTYQPITQANTPDNLSFPVQQTQTTVAQVAGSPFIGVGHSTSGAARIVEVGGQRYLEFDSAFRSEGGPDLFVLLHREAVPKSYSPQDYVNLGRLQALEGTQRYAIPAGIDTSVLMSAVIWCQQFDVTFGYAIL